MDIDWAAIQEAKRRYTGQQPSGAGISGGMQATNEMSAGNPVAQMGQANPALPPTSTNALDNTGTSEQVKTLNQALPQEANTIIKALTKTLDRLTGGNEQPTLA